MRALLLECAGLGLQLLGGAVTDSSRTAAGATAAAWGLPYVLAQVRFFASRRGTGPQDKHVQDEMQRQIDEAYELLQPLACSRRLIERVYSKRFRLLSAAAPPNSFPRELHERITTLQHITHTHTQQQQAVLMRKLWHSTELLNLRPETLQEKATSLSHQLQQQEGVTAELVQRLITTQPHMLAFRPETLAHKVADMAQRLGVLPPVVLSMWLRQRTVLNIAIDTFSAKLLELAGMLHLQEEDVQKLVVSTPALLASDLNSVQARFDNVLECLPHDIWTAEKLGPALMKHPAVLTYRPESVRHKWDVVGRYAAMHEPSSEQLQKQQQEATVLNFFTRPDAHIAMLEYIMQQQQQQQQQDHNVFSGHAEFHCSDEGSSSSSDDDSDVGSSSSSSSSSDDEGTLQQQSHSSSSSSSRRRGRQALELLVSGQAGPMPRLLCVLSPSKAKWAALQQQYPGFAVWYQQRTEEQPKQKLRRVRRGSSSSSM